MEEQENPIFVLAWVTKSNQKPTVMGGESEVLFVEHPERGWEIPGGHLESGESPEEALLRELFEETGMSGELKSWNTTYYPKGWVGHVIVEDTVEGTWSVSDEKVSEVRWWREVPPVKTWTIEEFQELSEWCAALSL